MTVPGLGDLSLAGFQDPWLFVFAVVPAALVMLYVRAVIGRRRRLRRFGDPDLMDAVAPRRPHPLRHVPIVLFVVSLVLLTVALAGPTRDTRTPRNRAVIVLAIDVSPSMRATDVAPNRLDAATKAAKRFARQLTPGVNLGLIAFAGNVNVLVSPTTAHEATVRALDHLRTDDATAIGDAIFAALQSVDAVAAMLGGGGDPPPPARIVVLSDGKETRPANPNNIHGAYTAARAAKAHGVPVSTIAFGTRGGSIEMEDQRVPVPIAADMLNRIAQLSGGQSYTASDVDQLNRSYAAVQQQVGYQIVPGPASASWLRLAVVAATLGALAAVVINRRLPT